jgi:hypothetical protein
VKLYTILRVFRLWNQVSSGFSPVPKSARVQMLDFRFQRGFVNKGFGPLFLIFRSSLWVSGEVLSGFSSVLGRVVKACELRFMFLRVKALLKRCRGHSSKYIHLK